MLNLLFLLQLMRCDKQSRHLTQFQSENWPSKIQPITFVVFGMSNQSRGGICKSRRWYYPGVYIRKGARLPYSGSRCFHESSCVVDIIDDLKKKKLDPLRWSIEIRELVSCFYSDRVAWIKKATWFSQHEPLCEIRAKGMPLQTDSDGRQQPLDLISSHLIGKSSFSINLKGLRITHPRPSAFVKCLNSTAN